MANITFLSFLLFSMCHYIHVAVNTWLNCSFFTLIIGNTDQSTVVINKFFAAEFWTIGHLLKQMYLTYVWGRPVVRICSGSLFRESAKRDIVELADSQHTSGKLCHLDTLCTCLII